MFERLLDNLYKALIREDRWRMYINGLGNTMRIALVACAMGIFIGVVVAIVKIYASDSKNPILRMLNAACTLYTTVIRGTPVVLQLLVLFNLAWMPNGITACMIGFGINSGAYVSETFRGGINSVDIGQMEAGRTLGLSRNKTMWYIILPQAIKNILPALFNEFIMLVKETSVAGYIAVADLTKVADGLRGRTLSMTHLYIAGAGYLTITFVLTLLQQAMERRLARSDRS